MTTCADLQTKLDTLEAAKLALITGGKAFITRYGDKDVQFQQSNIGDLRQEIRAVKLKMSRLRCAGCANARGIVHVTALDSNR